MNVMSNVDAVCDCLRRSGGRITPQRRAVIGAVLNDLKHPSTEDLFEHIRPDFPNIARTTIYDTLEIMVKAGFLHPLIGVPGALRYEGTLDGHGHLFCLHCGRIEDFTPPHDCSLEKIASRHRYRYESNTCIIFGACPNCS